MGVLRVKGASFFVVVFFSFAAKKTRSILTIPRRRIERDLF